jgi:hypothetical protein
MHQPPRDSIGAENILVTPSPYHDDALVDALVEALLDVWAKARACAEALGSGS